MTVEPYLALAAAHARRPVRMQWTRNESLLARAKRHRMTLRYRTGADGTILAQDIDITADAGAYAYLSALVLLYSSVHACGPYRVGAVRLRARCVHEQPSDVGLPGIWRHAGRLRLRVADGLLARELGIDPAEIRKRNALGRGDVLPVGQPIETEVLLGEAIDAVLERAGRRPDPSPRRRPRDRVQHAVLRTARG